MAQGEKKCNNCNTVVTSEFCPNCGQRTSINKVSFKETFHDLIDQLFSLSAPLPATLKMLIVNPGLLFREYLSGKRKKYYKPISFFLLATLLYIFVRWLIDFSPFAQTIGNPSSSPVIDEALMEQARDFMFRNINNLLFFFVITLALMLKVFFYRRYMLSEYLAVSFYLAGFYTLLTTVNLFYMKYVNPNIQVIAMMVMWGYFIYAMILFFERRKWLVGIKAFFTYLIAYVLYLFIAFYFSYFIVWINNS